jgi:tryptophanyl-tRNA synthetase
MAKLFLDENECKELQERYKKGGEGHGHFKLYLADVMWEYFRPYREQREYYLQHQDEVHDILANGAKKAKEIALPMIESIRSATGISY